MERLAGRDVFLRVLSTHHRACNLVSNQGDLIAVVAGSVGNGPFHVVLAEPELELDRPPRSAPATYQQGRLQVAGISIDLRQARVWEPKVSWPDPPVSAAAMELLARHACTWARSPLFPADTPLSPGRWSRFLAERASHAAETLCAGLRAGDVDLITWGVGSLAGLGPGLTPAGDDFLVGLMAGLRVWPVILPQGWTAERVWRLIVQVAANRTTLLSAAWLRHAAAGEFGEPWHELVNALAAGDEAAIQSAANRVLGTGATSGAHALAGFLAPFTEAAIAFYRQLGWEVTRDIVPMAKALTDDWRDLAEDPTWQSAWAS